MTISSEFSDSPRDMWELRLYVAGQSAKSIAAYRNLQRICDEHLAGRYQIEIVDVLNNPALARDDQIVALPTVVRKKPFPARKVLGDLSNTERVLVALQLRPQSSPSGTADGPPQT